MNDFRLAFSEEILLKARAQAPAVGRYLNLLSQAPKGYSEELRLKRHLSWLKAAIPSLVDINPNQTARLCLQWSQAADSLLSEAFTALLGGTPNLALFALGKLGSEELNLSSDVDLMFLCKGPQPSVKIVQSFQELLSQVQSFGFVFRLDFALRAGGRHGPLIATLDQFVDYYTNYGESWERLALLRLRPIAGDPGIAQEVLTFRDRFIYRKFRDYRVFEDLRSIRERMHLEKWNQNPKGFDIKHTQGAIRDAEFYVHCLQVLHGGRIESLRTCQTNRALHELNHLGLVPLEDVEFVRAHYWNLRTVENYIQAEEDRQTYRVDLSAKHPAKLKKILETVLSDLQRCSDLVKVLIGPRAAAPSKSPPKEDLLSPEDQFLLAALDSERVYSQNPERDRHTRKQVIVLLLNELRSLQMLSLQSRQRLKDFLIAIRAKSNFYLLLMHQPELVSQLAWILGHSGYLSQILIQRPELLDSFLYRKHLPFSQDHETFLEELLERKLLSELIAGSQFLKLRDLSALVLNQTQTADSICSELLSRLNQSQNSQVHILCLGKWGGQELGLKSDLDFIFVTREEPTTSDFKTAKRFVARLTEIHRGGVLYEVDLRLRPAGGAGPMITPLSNLRKFLREEAPIWHRQTFLRARWLGEKLDPIVEYFLDLGISPPELLELKEIQDRLSIENKKNPRCLDLKLDAGGIKDVEYSLQTLFMLRKLPPHSANTFSWFKQLNVHDSQLCQNYHELRSIEQLIHLTSNQSCSQICPGEIAESVARACNQSEKELLCHIEAMLIQNLSLLNQLDPRRQSE